MGIKLSLQPLPSVAAAHQGTRPDRYQLGHIPRRNIPPLHLLLPLQLREREVKFIANIYIYIYIFAVRVYIYNESEYFFDKKVLLTVFTLIQFYV